MTAWIKSINLYKLFVVPITFILQHIYKLTPVAFVDCFSKFMVFNHTFDIKVFNGTFFVHVAECTDSDTYKFFKPYRGSYRVKLIVLEKESPDTELIPEIY